MAKKYTVGQYLVDRLYEIGVRHLFAIPGDYCAVWVHDYLEPSKIQRIGSTNELNAGYAADGYARFSGVGAVCVTYSVGAFSLLNAIVGSFVEQVPVIAIVGAPSVEKRLQYVNTGFQWHHFVNGHDTDLRVYRNVTVAAERIDNPELAAMQIDYLLRECITQSGPVYLEITEDMYDQPIPPPKNKLTAAKTLSDPSSLEEAIRTVKGRLEIADHPLLWTGVEIERYDLRKRWKSCSKNSNSPTSPACWAKPLFPRPIPL